MKLEVPLFVEKFLDLVEEKVGKGRIFNELQEETTTTSFLESVTRLSNLLAAIHGGFDSDKGRASLINRVGAIQQRAMSYLEDEFRQLLEEPPKHTINESSETGKNAQDRQDQDQPNVEELPTDIFPGYPPETVANLKKISDQMIKAGYEYECREVYVVARRNSLEETLNHHLCYEKLSIDEVHRMPWDSMEREIPTWTKTFKDCATIYFPGEKKLADEVFSDHAAIAADLFTKVARSTEIQLLNFAEAVAMTKRSAEKLFKVLDMYETLRDHFAAVNDLFPEPFAKELKAEANTSRSRLGETAIYMFCDLENSIKSDTGKTPVPGGAVHPLTRYTMNYLRYACEYKTTLEQVFKEHWKIERADSTSRPRHDGVVDDDHDSNNADSKNNESVSPFSAQLMRVMDLLDSNLEKKSKLYKDIPLSCIFMMNNGRYIVQKIKGSAEIHQVMGDTWCRKRSSNLRNYHKNYQRETWGKLLGCLGHEGLMVNGKLVKPVLKERFKSFNAMFDEIHRTQSTWVVSDEQLQSELRVSISAVVIPAYRSFLGRFSQYLDPGRQTEKYIKFQEEDIETYIEELFDGNQASAMARRR
ncbi:exocyst complex component EXO70B1 [Carica papaya]|uniref:exocyst complex component EXO70B1 n=1 Tax=Carica papaya TaxID=3649 RepID=UPI000B8CD78A|nr:exocyst complex component EXO70B1 [Carica papaya]